MYFELKQNVTNQKPRPKHLSVNFGMQQITQQHPLTESNRDQENSKRLKYRIVLDFTRQELGQFQVSQIINKQTQVWSGVLHLILDDNHLESFDVEILRFMPQLQNLSLCGNKLKYFGPVMLADASCLCILNISRNQISEIDSSIYGLGLKRLFIQQNRILTISKMILDLRCCLEQLGLGWGIFCFTQINVVLESSQLKLFFKCLEAMPSEITFEYFVYNYRHIKEQCDQFLISCQLDSMRESEVLGDESINTLLDQLQSSKLSLSNIQHHQFCSSDFESRLQFPDNPFLKHNEYKQNLMHIAVIQNEPGILEYLIRKYPNMTNEIDLKGHSPLSLAIELQNYAFVTKILQTNANVNIGGGLSSSNMHLASIECQVQLVSDLLELGANPEVQDIFGDTPLHIASRHQDLKLVKGFYHTILKYNFDVNKQNLKGQSPLEVLVDKKNLITLQYCHDWNLSQFRSLPNTCQHHFFNFEQINPITHITLLDQAVLQRYIHIAIFFIDFNLIDITQQTLQFCFREKWKNEKRVFLYKFLKKASLIQIISTIADNSFQFENKKSLVVQSSFSKILIQEQELEDNSSIKINNSDSDDQYSDTSDCKPCQIQQNLFKLQTLKPKFQHSGQQISRVNNFTKSFYEGYNEQFEFQPPEDELDALPNQKLTFSNNITKKTIDSFYQVRSEVVEYKNGKQHLRQHNYSPNNIRIIEDRNLLFPKQKQSNQIALLQQKFRLIIIQIYDRLRSKVRHKHDLIIKYCQTQLQIVDQFLKSAIGKEFCKIDKQTMKDIENLKQLVKREEIRQPDYFCDQSLLAYEILR